MDPDEFAAVVTDVLATLEPPTLSTSTETAAFLAEAVERVVAVYPRPQRRGLFGVRAVAAAYGVEPAWVAATVRSVHRPVGIAGMKPRFGVRAITEAAGLDSHHVNAMVESGHSHLLASLIAG
jgi:hypothetical protein